jgi:hypothetical protein
MNRIFGLFCEIDQTRIIDFADIRRREQALASTEQAAPGWPAF